MKAFSASGVGVACGLAAMCIGGMPVGAADISERLAGGNENPPVVSPGTGRFLWVARQGRIDFTLRYNRLSQDGSDATQAHIHVANPGNNGPITVYLCSNLDNTPDLATQRDCPPSPAVIRGEIVATDVGEGVDGTTLVLEEGDLRGLIRLMRQGATYVNIHTVDHPPGEIRGQINPRPR